ncbi:GNAT family N-acetyltransferase [Vallitalea okinawensis]|uniref:GNAT family N-acetyltransferase n=1 Tax=Vallitalea okinawensis TaxID=2078660 RepID=UPI001A9A3B09|nr:GNAT family N-acetyltransferase [Vallitalea okinawensis]
MIKGVWKKGTDNLHEAFEIRKKVFVEEQNVPQELEYDEYDRQADHIIIYEGNQPVATGRLFETDDSIFMLGRIAVLREYRGKSIGDFLVRMMVRKAFDEGAKEVQLHAQLSVKKFYEKLGFIAYGDIFDEAGIDHIHMKRDRDVGGCCG